VTHRGRNSKQHNIKYLARRVVFNAAFYDEHAAETVNQITQVQVINALGSLLPLEGLRLSDIPNVERGEVLRDSRGNGSFQQK
jgi:hypothetical protein